MDDLVIPSSTNTDWAVWDCQGEYWVKYGFQFLLFYQEEAEIYENCNSKKHQ